MNAAVNLPREILFRTNGIIDIISCQSYFLFVMERDVLECINISDVGSAHLRLESFPPEVQTGHFKELNNDRERAITTGKR